MLNSFRLSLFLIFAFVSILLYSVSAILLPFVLGLILAYLLNPVTILLEKHISRSFAAVVSLLILILILVATLLVIGPYLYQELSLFVKEMPDYLANLRNVISPHIDEFYNNFGIKIYDGDNTVLQKASQNIIKLSTGLLSNLWNSSLAIINVVALLIITPIVSFYLLRDWQDIVMNFYNLVPRRHLKTVKSLMTQIDRVLSGYIRGQLNVCFILGVFYSLGLGLVGLTYGVLLGFVSGILVLLPYFGVAIGMSIGVVLAYLQFGDYYQIMLVLFVYLFGQFVEGNFITPKLVGDKVGLHPAIIIFSLLSGATLFGFVGILFAIPFTASLWVCLHHFVLLYKKSSSYK
jgi:predicted PurR-regulated permease PerM